jgi:hypothetical protein
MRGKFIFRCSGVAYFLFYIKLKIIIEVTTFMEFSHSWEYIPSPIEEFVAFLGNRMSITIFPRNSRL